MTDGDELVAAFGRVAREERLRQRIAQDELRRRCGMHRNYVGAIENGRVRPTLPTLARLAAGLGVPLAELIARAETHARSAESRGRRRR